MHISMHFKQSQARLIISNPRNRAPINMYDTMHMGRVRRCGPFHALLPTQAQRIYTPYYCQLLIMYRYNFNNIDATIRAMVMSNSNSIIGNNESSNTIHLFNCVGFINLTRYVRVCVYVCAHVLHTHCTVRCRAI